MTQEVAVATRREVAATRLDSDPTMLAVLKAGGIDALREYTKFRNEERAVNNLIAFNNAFADAKAKIRPIKKNRVVAFESKKAGATDVSYTHEDLAAIADGVDEALSEFGLSYRFRPTELEGGRFKLTCVISHRDGHFEETTLPGSRDTSGAKNDLQGTMSTMTYLQRYTLKLALGLAVEGDDDGRAGGAAAGAAPQFVSEAQLKELIALADELNVDKAIFCGLPTIKAESLAHIAAKDFDHAKATMELKRGRKGSK